MKYLRLISIEELASEKHCPNFNPRGNMADNLPMPTIIYNYIVFMHCFQKSKRKFAQLAGMFSRRKGGKQLLDQAPDDNLLLNAEPLVQVRSHSWS
jgi:hypothetical protein